MSTSIHPYDPPKSTPIPQLHVPPSPFPKEPALRAFIFLMASFVFVIAGFMLESSWHNASVRFLTTTALGIATALAAAATLCGIHGGVAMVRGALPVTGVRILGSLAATGVSGFISFATFVMTVWSNADFRRGRQLRRFGRVLLPPVEGGEAWATLAFESLPDEARRTAAQWRENGRTEHASVAAFAALSTELMALGAPPTLVAAANRDALDEIRHTELCFSLARALDGREESPGPFPEARRPGSLPLGRTFALARLAADSLVDGALHEGVSARVIAKLGRRCEVPPVRAMLKEIARDEGRHSAHGWDVVVWCVAKGGSPVMTALQAALRALPASMLSPLPEEARLGGWERFGIHGHALEQAEYVAALAELHRRVDALAREQARAEEILPEAC